MKINEALKNIRKSKGYSQEQVADYIGIDTTNYGRIERGRSSISFDRLVQLAGRGSITKVNIVINLLNILITILFAVGFLLATREMKKQNF